MKPQIKPILFTTLFALLLFLLYSQSPVKAAVQNNPIFATIDYVQNAISTALSPIQSSIQTLTNRVNNLEASITPVPTPPLKGIWVSVAAISDPGGLGYYFNMSPRITTNNFQTLYNTYQWVNADCWATVHFSNGDALGFNTNRGNPLQIVSPNHVLPTDGTKIPTDLYCSWGGSTLT